jgi:hypothetical protein
MTKQTFHAKISHYKYLEIIINAKNKTTILDKLNSTIPQLALMAIHYSVQLNSISKDNSNCTALHRGVILDNSNSLMLIIL